MPKKRDSNPLSYSADLLQIVINTMKELESNEKIPVIRGIYKSIRRYSSISKHQLYVVMEYEEYRGKPILMMADNGVIRNASEAEKIKALIRKTEPQNIRFTEDD